MYSEKVMDHFTNPRNMGEIENARGVGTVGNARCGDIMRIYLKVNDDTDVIEDVKFMTFGCGAAAAALLLGGMLAAWLLACALPDEDTLADRFGSRTQGSAMRAALVTGAALLLHNLPEGILTLLTNVSDPQLGARTALAIALHNIPEGLAVAVPFACATGSRAKGAVAALVSGLAEPAGAILAALVLAPLLTPGLLNGIVAVVAGIMLWVAAAQLLPAAFEPAWRKMGVTGFCVGVLLMILGIAALA